MPSSRSRSIDDRARALRDDVLAAVRERTSRSRTPSRRPSPGSSSTAATPRRSGRRGGHGAGSTDRTAGRPAASTRHSARSASAGSAAFRSAGRRRSRPEAGRARSSSERLEHRPGQPAATCAGRTTICIAPSVFGRRPDSRPRRSAGPGRPSRRADRRPCHPTQGHRVADGDERAGCIEEDQLELRAIARRQWPKGPVRDLVLAHERGPDRRRCGRRSRRPVPVARRTT